ncbi:hypothetical protein [Acinetobacter nosocomialis]|uniref:hypothetical protein n=1 Tax=Acinetobacter nosocomialis TaxID=106654 RepID=UPI0033AD2234
MSSNGVIKLDSLLPGKYQANTIFRNKTIGEILEGGNPEAIVEIIRYRDMLINLKVQSGKTKEQAAGAFHPEVHMCLDLYIYTNYESLQKFFIRFNKERLKLELREYNLRKKKEERDKQLALEAEKRLAREKELEKQRKLEERAKLYGDTLGSW